MRKIRTKSDTRVSRYDAMAAILKNADGLVSFTEDPRGGSTQYCLIKFTTPSAKTATDASELPREISRILNEIRLEAQGIATHEEDGQ